MRYNKTEAKFTSHYILKRFFRQFAINDNDVSAGKSNTKCHSIYLCRYSLRFGNLRPGNSLLKQTLNETCSSRKLFPTRHVLEMLVDLKKNKKCFRSYRGLSKPSNLFFLTFSFRLPSFMSLTASHCLLIYTGFQRF